MGFRRGSGDLPAPLDGVHPPQSGCLKLLKTVDVSLDLRISPEGIRREIKTETWWFLRQLGCTGTGLAGLVHAQRLGWQQWGRSCVVKSFPQHTPEAHQQRAQRAGLSNPRGCVKQSPGEGVSQPREPTCIPHRVWPQHLVSRVGFGMGRETWCSWLQTEVVLPQNLDVHGHPAASGTMWGTT